MSNRHDMIETSRRNKLFRDVTPLPHSRCCRAPDEGSPRTASSLPRPQEAKPPIPLGTPGSPGRKNPLFHPISIDIVIEHLAFIPG